MNLNRFNNRISVLIVMLAVLSSVFFDCNSSQSTKDKSIKDAISSNSGSNSNPYFPVASGMKWEYFNEAPRDETEIFTAEISEVKSEEEVTTASFISFPYFYKQKDKASIKITKAGEVYVVDTAGNEKMLLPEASKLTQGYNWKYGDWAAYVGGTGLKVKTENEEISDCVYISYSLGGFTFSVELWLAKDKGIVKWGSNRTNPPSRNILYYVLNKITK